MGWINNAGNLSQAQFPCKSNCRFCAKVPLPSLHLVHRVRIRPRKSCFMSLVTPEDRSDSPGKSGDHLQRPVGRFLFLMVCSLGMLGGLIVPFPISGRHWNAIFDLAHAPAFFLIFLLIAGVLDPVSIGFSRNSRALLRLTRQRLLLLSGLLFMGGVGCEVAQKFVERHPSMSDIIANSAGLMAGTLYCFSLRIHQRWSLLLGVPLAALIVLFPCVTPVLELIECGRQRQEFPLVASFERTRELAAWTSHGATISCDTTWASHGTQSMQISSLSEHQPGAVMVWPIRDWSAYSTLQFELFNPQSRNVTVGITISDDDHVRNLWEPSDRFNWSVELMPLEVKTVSISLQDVASSPLTRMMNLTQLSNLNIFMTNATPESKLYVDGIHLLK